jgi:hypothetical protein
MKKEDALKVWETIKRYPSGVSKTKVARLTGFPVSYVEMIIDKLLRMRSLEHRWIGYDRYYAVGDFFDEWELLDEDNHDSVNA